MRIPGTWRHAFIRNGGRYFLADRTEENRAAARAAFLAVPQTQRRYALGDMDSKDRPLRVLVAGPGGRTYLPFEGTVTQETYDSALAYFEERARRQAERSGRVPADGPVTSHAPAVHLAQTFPKELPDGPGKLGLRHDHPAPITVADTAHPSVAHAYRALSAAEPEGWGHARTAVTAALLRAKYDQHPELAGVLLATGDATLLYDDTNSDFWGDNAGRGRNWSGRLLELVRSELQARRTGTAGV